MPSWGLLCKPPNYNHDSLSLLERCPDLYSTGFPAWFSPIYAFLNKVHLVLLSCVYSVKTCSIISMVFVTCFQLSMTRMFPITIYCSTVLTDHNVLCTLLLITSDLGEQLQIVCTCFPLYIYIHVQLHLFFLNIYL